VKEILAAGGYTTVNTLGSGFSQPQGVVLDASGNVYVADTGNSAVKEILAAGGYTTVNTLGIVFNATHEPNGVALDGYGNLFATGNNSDQHLYKETLSLSHQASKSLLASGSGSDSIGTYVLTDSNGNWTISGDYTCDAGAQAYIYALGGNSGSGTNTGIGLMAALGQCPGSTPFTFAVADPFVDVDEVTTVAAAYAMAGYATDATHVSSNNTSLAKQGIANAFANAASLATVSTGVANTAVPGNTSNSTAPQALINTLGNILAACVNSATGSANCTTLFTNAESAGSSGTAPTDTATAAINIAHNPGNAITALYGLQPGSGAPYVTHLSSQPNDFTVGIKFTGNGLSEPYDIAIDGSGNAWITNLGNSSVTEIAASGVSASNYKPSGSNFSSPTGIAIDTSGNAWVANRSGNSVTELTSSGGLVGNYAPSGSNFNFLFGIAIDASGHAWAGNYNGNSVTELTSSGGLVGNYVPSGSNFNSPYGLAFDISGNAWITNQNGSSVTELTSSGGLVGNYAPSGSGFNSPYVIAIDAAGNSWVTNGGDSITELTSSGGLVGNYAPSGSNFNNPHGIAIDGSGNAWITNETGNNITELNSGGSLAGNYAPTGSNVPYFIAIDGSGNAWITNFGGSSITEIVGAATPVATPTVANLLSPYGAHTVNLP
jgi:streptogramin lyase